MPQQCQVAHHHRARRQNQAAPLATPVAAPSQVLVRFCCSSGHSSKSTTVFFRRRSQAIHCAITFNVNYSHCNTSSKISYFRIGRQQLNTWTRDGCKLCALSGRLSAHTRADHMTKTAQAIFSQGCFAVGKPKLEFSLFHILVATTTCETKIYASYLRVKQGWSTSATRASSTVPCNASFTFASSGC